MKNVENDVDGDRILREIGAASGVGVTHLLFVVPRAKLNAAAERERLLRSALTDLHIYVLGVDDLVDPTAEAVIARLRRQEALLARVKKREAERREKALG